MGTDPEERAVWWGHIELSRSGQNDKLSQLRAWASKNGKFHMVIFQIFHRGPGSNLEHFFFFSLDQLWTDSPIENGHLWQFTVSRGRNREHVIYFPASNRFFLSFMKEFPANPPPVVPVGCVPAAQRNDSIGSVYMNSPPELLLTT